MKESNESQAMSHVVDENPGTELVDAECVPVGKELSRDNDHTRSTFSGGVPRSSGVLYLTTNGWS